MKSKTDLLIECLKISMDINTAYGKLLKTCDPKKETVRIKELNTLSLKIQNALKNLGELSHE